MNSEGHTLGTCNCPSCRFCHYDTSELLEIGRKKLCQHVPAVPARRVSLRKLLLATRSHWEAVELGGRSLTAKQRTHMIQRYFDRLQREAMLSTRRGRHSRRAVQQPVSGWPRLRDPCGASGDISITNHHCPVTLQTLLVAAAAAAILRLPRRLWRGRNFPRKSAS